MGIPTWAYQSNYNLGTDPVTKEVRPFSERTTLSIPIIVYDEEDMSSLETRIFDNAIDSTLLPTYSNAEYFWVKSTGMPQNAWLGQPDAVNAYTPVPQNYTFKFPREQRTIEGKPTSVINRRQTNTPTIDIFGVAVDGVPLRSPNSGIIAEIGGVKYTENSALYPIKAYQEDSSDPWGPFSDGSGIIRSDRKFHYITDPRFLYEKDSTKHSPVIGYAFDGNPIYGPYGYSVRFLGEYSASFQYRAGDIVRPTVTDNTFYIANIDNVGIELSNTTYWRLANSTEPYQIMRTSYRISDVQRSNGTIPDGTYIEDFEYVNGLGDLDKHNGRFVRTPEYPTGTYAYFVTVDPDDLYLPRYPYILGPTYYQEPLLPNGNFEFPGDISLEIISGQLPPGLRIEGLNIVGTPFEVPTEKDFRFVLRATNATGLSDRTYYMTIEGADKPIWLTPPGDLQVGTEGDRSEVVNRSLDQQANIGNSILKLTSVRSLLRNSIVSSGDYPNAFASDTKITSIDTVSKTVAISRPVNSIVPWGSRLTFTSVYKHVNLFVLDGDYVDYQLSAIDQDLATGQKLTYYIPPRGGELPPGLTLSLDGIISGFTEPILLNDLGEFNGNYDMHLYDKYAYDYGVRPYNGFDSFLYDNTVFDYSDTIRNPRKLNRYYSFIVRVSDGQYYEDRRFRIFVVGDDTFRSDTTIMEVGTRIYTADVTPIRKPLWLTPSYLGKRRANNYITTFLDVYDVNTLRGGLGYVLDPVNDDGSISRLPPGMVLDQITGEIYGDVPYQPAVTKTYKFTVRAIRYDPDNPLYGTEQFTNGVNGVGQNVLKLNSVLNLRLDSLVTNPTGIVYIAPGTVITAIDAGSKTVTLSTNILQTIPNNTRFTFSYVVSSPKTFTLDIIGEIDSTISFKTPGDLGEIPANFISDLYIEAKSNVDKAVLYYTLIGGRLPPGLSLVNDGTIQGKVRQFSEGVYRSYWKAFRVYAINDIVRYEDKYYIALEPNEKSSFDISNWIEYYQFPDGIFKSYWKPFVPYFINDIVRYEENYYIATSPSNAETFSYDTWAVYTDTTGGLTIFDKNDFTLDKSNTSIDREYKFIALARDQFKLSAVTKNFTVSVTTPNDLLYSNIYVKPFLKNSKRLELTDFFTNPEIFEHDKLYRPSDPSFGVQTELKMLLYAGIETKDASEYAAALGRSSKKRYRFGSVKKSVAKIPGTNDVVYEAIYVEVIDNMETSKGSVSKSIKIEYGKDPTRFVDDSSKVPLQTDIKINQSKRDIWDSYGKNVFYNKISAPAGSRSLTLNSTFNIDKNDIINSALGTYFRPGTNILSVDRITNVITFDKPLLSQIPTNTQLRFSKDELSRIWMQDKVMTADYQGQLASDINVRNLFGNSTTNIRKNIEELGETERNFLPLWMRTPQSFSGIEQGFTKGVLLCYAKPGFGDRIINNIKNLGIDFKTIDFTVDRVIIDSVKGQSGDKYIAFAAREIING